MYLRPNNNLAGNTSFYQSFCSAVICEFKSIVKMLLMAGAKTNLPDNEGNMATDLTSEFSLLELSVS